MMISLHALAAVFLLQGATVDTARPPAAQEQPLTFDEFYRAVAEHHPVVRQARLLEEIADADVRQATGAFDPSLSAGWDRKTFKGSRYYDYLDASLKIPTPLGVDVKVGYERTLGEYFATDRRTPAGGLLTAGLSIPLGRGMITDERRTALATARALRDYARGERAALVNKFLLTAAKLYGSWYESHRRLGMTEQGVSLADFRLRSIRSRVERGDAAAIDTIEASLELQKRRVARQEALVDFRNASLAVEGALWSRRGDPLELPAGAVPSVEGLQPAPVDSSSIARWLIVAERNHPNLRKAIAKARQAEAERLLSAQQVFIPAAELSYSALGERAQGTSALADAFGTNDVKLGGGIKIPLLYLKERGKFSATQDKLEQKRLEVALVRRDIGIAVASAVNELRGLDTLITLQRTTVLQARALRDGEQRKFDSGESTLFLVNTRERSVIDEEIKLIALEAKYAGARAALAVAIGEPALLPSQ